MAFISGCATTPPPPKPVTVPELEAPIVEEVQIVEPDPNPKGRAQKLALHAVQMLQTGAADTAQAELQEAIRLDPDNKLAQSLIRQGMVDPVAILGSRYFLYTVRPGDTLSKIAQRFLGDLYQFYILARYNNIQNSSQLEVDTVIKIPGIAPAPTPIPMLSTSPIPRAPPPSVSKSRVDAKTLAEARRLIRSGAYNQVIKLLQPRLQEVPNDPSAANLLVNAYLDYAKQLRAQGNEDEAKQQLQQALVLQPGNSEVNIQLQGIESGSWVERLYQSGLQSLKKGEREKAYAAFIEVLKINPRHIPAAQKAKEVKQDMIQLYHKSAMEAFHRQDLDSAIKQWDKVLVLNPDNESAKLNRARALELRERIHKFGK